MNHFTVILGYDMIKYNKKYDDIKATFQRECFFIRKKRTLIMRTEVSKLKVKRLYKRLKARFFSNSIFKL
eukprot:UN17349